MLRNLETQTYILHLNKKTYKIFSPIGTEFQHAELQANKEALLAGFWTGNVVEVSPFLTCLAMPRGNKMVQEKLADHFLDTKLNQALQYPGQQISDLVDLDRLKELERHGLKQNLINEACRMMMDCKLPATSTHGDLHTGNMIVLNNEIKVIDWTMFNPNGSFITDYIHYYNYLDACRQKKSWTQTILQDSVYLKKLSQQLGIPTGLLRLAYTLSRIYGETCQERELSFIPPKQIQKYNYVLDNLIANA